jgi:hypothetical protein
MRALALEGQLLALLEHPGYLAGRSGFLRQSGPEMLATNLSTRPTADIPPAHGPYFTVSSSS